MTDEEKKEARKVYNAGIAIGDQCRTSGMELIRIGGPMMAGALLAYIDAMRESSDNPIEQAVGCMALIGFGECTLGVAGEILAEENKKEATNDDRPTHQGDASR